MTTPVGFAWLYPPYNWVPRPRRSVALRRPKWIPAPRFHEDKLRGNDIGRDKHAAFTIRACRGAKPLCREFEGVRRLTTVSLREAKRRSNLRVGYAVKRARRLPRLLLAWPGEWLAMTGWGGVGVQGVEEGMCGGFPVNRGVTNCILIAATMAWKGAGAWLVGTLGRGLPVERIVWLDARSLDFWKRL